MVLIYLTAVNASKFDSQGTIIGIEIVSNSTTAKEVFALDERPDIAKLHVLNMILDSLSVTNEKVTVFVDDERLAEEYACVVHEEQDLLQHHQLWAKVVRSARHYLWPITIKGKAHLSNLLYDELYEALETKKVKPKTLPVEYM